MKSPLTAFLPVHTPDGTFMAHYSERGLAVLDFPASTRRSDKPGLEISRALRTWHALTRQAVLAVLANQPVGWLPPLDLTAGTGFQRRVWQELQRIPAGQTRGYGEIAAAIGQQNAARAVGQACGANPIPLLIPCHRVLAANGRLGGFSGGLKWKRLLLAREMVQPATGFAGRPTPDRS